MARPKATAKACKIVGDTADTKPSDVVSRRRAFALGASAVLFTTRGARAAVVSPPVPAIVSVALDQASLIVGGPDNGPLAAWAHVLGAAIGQRVGTSKAGLRITFVGGADGVTAANQFEARSAPDGATALLISGSAAMAWLVGDQRAQFDAGHWLPVATGLGSSVVVGRSLTALNTFAAGGDRPRIVSSSGADLALAATLGLSLLGIETKLLADNKDPLAAFQQGRADLALLRGPNLSDTTVAARGLGAMPLFSSGVLDDSGGLTRDPLLPDIPTLPELLRTHQTTSVSPGLLAAWHATAASAELEFALVLPFLTLSGVVSQWRKAVSQVTAGPKADITTDAVTRHAQTNAIRLQTDPAANFGLSAIAVDTNTLLELRRWMASRLP